MSNYDGSKTTIHVSEDDILTAGKSGANTHEVGRFAPVEGGGFGYQPPNSQFALTPKSLRTIADLLEAKNTEAEL